jgi:hypothetical protein
MSRHGSRRTHTSPFVLAVLLSAVLVLSAIGFSTAIGRLVFLADFEMRLQSIRQQVHERFGLAGLLLPPPNLELQRFDARFPAHRTATWLHLLPASVFLVLAPLQFSSTMRTRFILFHRWSGRLLLLMAITSCLAGLYVGFVAPYAGVPETIVSTLFGLFFLVTLVKGFGAIRGGQTVGHRKWMIRAFALVLTASTARLALMGLDPLLRPIGAHYTTVFVLSLVVGWSVTSGAAELWINYSRPPLPSLLSQFVLTVKDRT